MPDVAAWPETRPDAKPTPIRQRWRELGAMHDVSRAPGVGLASLTSPAKSLEEFITRPITAGCFVFAAAAKRSSLARQCLRLAKIDWWVWKVLGVLEKNDPLPSNSRQLKYATSTTYEAQLHAPIQRSLDKKFRALWDKRHVHCFLYTPEEKASCRSRGQGHKHDEREDESAKTLTPVTAMLRPENVMGGGFFALTNARCLPKIAKDYLSTL